MKNGSMFKDISRYKDQGYFDQHSEIILYTPEREIHLKALAAVCTSPDAIRRKTEFASGRRICVIYSADDSGRERVRADRGDDRAFVFICDMQL